MTRWTSPAWQEALRRRVKALYATMRRLYDDEPVPRRGDQARRLPRLRRRRRHRADGRGRHRLRQVLQEGAAGGPGQGGRPAGRRRSRAGGRRPAGRRRRCATPGCVEVGHVDGRRWGVGLAERPFPPQGAAGRGRAHAGSGQRRPRHRGGRQHRLGDHGRPRARRRAADLPPARPDPGARPRRPGPASVPRGPGRSQGATSPRGCKDRGERPTPVAIEKELAALRTAGRRPGCHRRRARPPAAPRTTTRVDLTDADAVARVLDRVAGHQRPHRPAAARGRAGDQPGAARTRSRASSTWCFGVKSDGWFNVLQRRRRPADRRDGRLLLGGRPVRQRRADRLQRRQRPAVQDHQQLAPYPARRPGRSPSTGRPGAASAWRPAAPSRRSWRWPASRCCHRRPASPGSGGSSPRTASAVRSSSPARSGLMADGYHPTGGLDAAALDVVGAGPLVGEVVGADLLRRARGADHAGPDGPAVPRPTTASTGPPSCPA